MESKKDYLLRRLGETEEETLRFFETLPEHIWERQVYTDGAAWTVRQVLAHIALAEDSMRRLIEGVLAGGAGTPEDFDLNAYNEYKVQKQGSGSPAELLAFFRQARAQTRQLVQQLQPEDLDRPARHPVLGETRVGEIVKMIYRHARMHRRDIRRLLAEEQGAA